MSSHTEKWKGPNGVPNFANIHPEKLGGGDTKVWQVGMGKKGYKGHLTVHGDGTVNRHGSLAPNTNRTLKK